MKIFVAGASGAIGARLVPALVQRRPRGGRHHSHARQDRTSAPVGRRARRARRARRGRGERCGRRGIARGRGARAHDIPDTIDPRKLDQQFAATNRLRTEGMDHLLEASRAAGVRRFVAQSFGAWVYARTGGPGEGRDRRDGDRPADERASDARRHPARRASLNEATDVEGIALRYGGFYGPGTSMGEGAEMLEMIGSADSRSWAAAPASGRSSTSTTLPRRRSPRSRAAGPASTT